jgi:hypothetical protein
MDVEPALDAALLVFLRSGAADVAVRDQLRMALDAYEDALRSCSACRGTTRLTARSPRFYVKENQFDRNRPRALVPGEEVECIACNGIGVDRETTEWRCRLALGNGACSPEGRLPRHDECGWVRPVIVPVHEPAHRTDG